MLSPSALPHLVSGLRTSRMSTSSFDRDLAGTESLAYDPLIEEVDQAVAEDVDAGDSPRRQAVVRAVKAWVDQLVDRSARNNLLFFRDQRTGTLDFSRVEQGPVFTVLAGRSRGVTQLVGSDEDARADAVRRAKGI